MSRRAIAFAVLLVLWGNVLPPLIGSSAWLPGGSWSFVIAGLALIGVSLAATRWLRLDAGALGLAGDPLRGALVGLAVGAGAAAIGVSALRTVATALVGRPIEYAPLATATGPDLARHIAFFLPLGAILPEEIAFRGVLLGALVHAFGARRAIVASGIAFALWHVSVVAVTIGDTTLGPPSPWFGVAAAGALLAVFIGGALVSWLRLRTGSLSTTIVAHWSFNAVVLVGLWSTRGPAPSGCC
jgi:membrane protease YdiL (CAAX protease family)